MPINENDLRVKKTRRSLRDAFVRLILKQGYDSIAIQHITDEAETARVTFYRHYRDKEELLNDCLNVLYEELSERIEQLTPEQAHKGDSPVRVFYEHLEEQEALYRVLFSSKGTQTVIERLRHHLALKATETIKSYADFRSIKVPLEIISYHAASAQIGLGIWWLDHGKPYPAQYMAQLSLWLSLAGVAKAIGIETFNLPAPQMP
jgi:AcrR family transcriptional regulator